MTKTCCDFCGKEYEPKRTIIGDLDNKNMVEIEFKPKELNKTDVRIPNPDLCPYCLIKAIKDAYSID